LSADVALSKFHETMRFVKAGRIMLVYYLTVYERRINETADDLRRSVFEPTYGPPLIPRATFFEYKAICDFLLDYFTPTVIPYSSHAWMRHHVVFCLFVLFVY
jgi:hypothetical protein